MPGEPLEVAGDHRLCLVRLDLQPGREAPARDAVEDREVDGLCPAARVAIDLAEQLLRGRGMNVLAAQEGFAQLGNVGHMRREPQLDLAVVGGENDIARLGDEGVADLLAGVGADRDVLQVGVGR